MTHLTLIGYEAGRVICGAPKVQGNTYLHAMYAPTSVIYSDECCPECRKLWDEAVDVNELTPKQANAILENS